MAISRAEMLKGLTFLICASGSENRDLQTAVRAAGGHLNFLVTPSVRSNLLVTTRFLMSDMIQVNFVIATEDQLEAYKVQAAAKRRVPILLPEFIHASIAAGRLLPTDQFKLEKRSTQGGKAGSSLDVIQVAEERPGTNLFIAEFISRSVSVRLWEHSSHSASILRLWHSRSFLGPDSDLGVSSAPHIAAVAWSSVDAVPYPADYEIIRHDFFKVRARAAVMVLFSLTRGRRFVRGRVEVSSLSSCITLAAQRNHIVFTNKLVFWQALRPRAGPRAPPFSWLSPPPLRSPRLRMLSLPAWSTSPLALILFLVSGRLRYLITGGGSK